MADGPSRVAHFKGDTGTLKLQFEATESARVQPPSKGSGQEDPGETPWGVRASCGALVRHLKCSPELENAVREPLAWFSLCHRQRTFLLVPTCFASFVWPRPVAVPPGGGLPGLGSLQSFSFAPQLLSGGLEASEVQFPSGFPLFPNRIFLGSVFPSESPDLRTLGLCLRLRPPLPPPHPVLPVQHLSGSQPQCSERAPPGFDWPAAVPPFCSLLFLLSVLP